MSKPLLWRRALAAPIWVVCLALAFVCGRGILWLANGLVRLSNGTEIHIWWPIVGVRRWIEGRPTWLPADTIHSPLLQPRTKAQRELADADPRLRFVRCTCKRRGCPFREGMYVPSASTQAVMDKLNEIVEPLRAAGMDVTVDIRPSSDLETSQPKDR